MCTLQEKEMAKVLAEDATVYDYDGALSEIQKEREKIAAHKVKPIPYEPRSSTPGTATIFEV